MYTNREGNYDPITYILKYLSSFSAKIFHFIFYLEKGTDKTNVMIKASFKYVAIQQALKVSNFANSYYHIFFMIMHFIG